MNTAVSGRVHGGPDALGVPLHDFSTNSNACGPCPLAQAAVRQADAGRYPDASYAALRGRLADFHGVLPQRIVLAASASEFIFRITAAVAMRETTLDKTVWLPPHSYGDYAQAAQAHTLTVVDDDSRAGLRWACEPSSPLGAAQPGLTRWGGGAASPAVTVLDRAYEPLRLDGACSLDAAGLDAVWQLWTPNKALGLTGVRAAYAMAPVGEGAQTLADLLDRLCPSWLVGAHGVALLDAWTTPGVQAWLADSLDTLRAWKRSQRAVCESLGWTCLPSDANFFCAQPALPPGQDMAPALAALRGQGIKLRDTTSFGLPDHVRLGVLAPDAQQALHNAWLHTAAAAGGRFT